MANTLRFFKGVFQGPIGIASLVGVLLITGIITLFMSKWILSSTCLGLALFIVLKVRQTLQPHWKVKPEEKPQEIESARFADLIKQRQSWRSFTSRPIEVDKIQQIEAFLADPVQTTGPFGSRIKMHFVRSEMEGRQKLGTYGFIHNAKYFIVGRLAPGQSPADFGYVFEKAILLCQRLGLGTCWLHGIQRSTFEATLTPTEPLTPGEKLFMGSPVGYVSDERNFAGAIFHHPGRRKAVEKIFFHSAEMMPFAGSGEAMRFAPALEAVRLAPSGMNMQPWRVVCEDPATLSTWHFFDESNKMIPYVPCDTGIAMTHWDLVTRELGLEGRWEKRAACPVKNMATKHYVGTWIKNE
eukprot:gnl/Trimastix_PCT/3030.p1 GENE.gnl/Trimastix_PCT/3030~~gnl/Trimastix_PCT/3030.p1  ORF type:complete len:354 (-),score=53.58 gnl/Trimastix_PCT/3030:116-1177(-)